VISLVTLPVFADYYYKIGAGHTYADLISVGVKHDAAFGMAENAGVTASALMIFGQHIPLSIFLFVAAGLISKTTSSGFKKKLRYLYLFTALIGILFLALGASYWGEAPQMPFALLPSSMMYFFVSLPIWILIGIGILIRRRLFR